ncbi:hypothetical protein [Alteromonas flava]|uniref:hypothetical protein n=1 Tax=Alteromonas flava TaxID=2048003 RepID=UPI000C2849B8|nr:hypothetical protein [Alteromonas flava]
MKLLNIGFFVITAVLSSNFSHAQDKASLLEQYKAEAKRQAESFPIAINERNLLRNAFIEGTTHVFEIQVIDRLASDISDGEKAKIEKQLDGTLGALYCKDGTNESVPRTLGVAIEYRYLDKMLTPFQSVVFSQNKCDGVTAITMTDRTEDEIRVEMQIRELMKVGTGSVEVCKEYLGTGILSVSFSNEGPNRAVIWVSDEYIVNTIMFTLDKSQVIEFRETLNEAEIKAASAPNLENLNLSSFGAGASKVKLLGKKGQVYGYFTYAQTVDRVYLSLDAKTINHCLSQITPFL